MVGFDYAAAAELFAGGATKFRRSPLDYKRFSQASDAIRFAIEELNPKLLRGSYIEIDEERYNSADIERLYESADYPHARGARAEEPAAPKKRRG